jgi:hypothetical protein
MDFAQTLIEGFVNIVIAAGAVLLVGLACLVIIRALPMFLPIAFRFAVTFGAIAGRLLAVVFNFLTQIAPFLVNLLVIGATIYGTLHGATDTFQAYGADVIALLPAVLVILLTMAAGLAGRSWGALLAGGLAAYGIGAIVYAGDYTFRALVIVGALALTIAHNQFTTGESNHEKQQHLSEADQNRAGGLHGGPLDRSGAIDYAGQYEDVRDSDRVWSGPGPVGLG